MNLFRKIQKINVFWKRLIVFAVLFVLAVPLLILIGNSFQKRVTKFDQEGFFEELNLPEFTEEIGGSFEELRQELEKVATTTPTTTYGEEETDQTTE